VLPSAAIDTEALLDVILAGFIAGVGITAVFGLVIYGGTRFADLRRQGNAVGAAFFACLGVIGFAAFAASVVLGLLILTDK
jgi:hypothetical protein